MVTADIFEKLKELQDVLVQKYELEAKVEEAPKQLSAQDELLARLKKEYIAKNTNYESVKDKVLALRFDLDQAVKLREDGEKGMENVETHREYEALGKQIAEATDKENEVRKELQKEEDKRYLKEFWDRMESKITDISNRIIYCLFSLTFN